MKLYLYNTQTRSKDLFVPQTADHVTLYVCGPTVYGPAHIGNARPAVVFDVLVRLLRDLYPQVTYARNITDVDDKINKKAAEEGVEISEIAARFTDKYHLDMGTLGVKLPDVEPYATQHIAEIQDMISRLISTGHAYEADGHVLFDVNSDPDYGSLSRRQREDMIAGARVEVASYKRNPEDFVLWKPSPDDLPGWPSSFGAEPGRGRPGWHIECSAMIAAHFGKTVDIHGGGIDLQFPHHENECAQSRCAHDAPLANYWMHNGMLNMSGEKMSKSLGNVRLVEELLVEYPGEVIRLALLQGHYRQPIDFTSELLQQSRRNLDKLYGLLREDRDVTQAALDASEAVQLDSEFYGALCDDLNTPRALAALFEMSKSTSDVQGRAKLIKAANLLGLLSGDPEDWFHGDDVDTAKVEALIAQRADARKAKDFAAADSARDELTAMGVTIEDTPNGTIWRMAR